MVTALEIIRHHRLLELYLNQKVGIEWHKVDAEAEELEHVLSDEVEAAMVASLHEDTRKAFQNYDLTFMVHSAAEKNITIVDNWLDQIGVSTESLMAAAVRKRW